MNNGEYKKYLWQQDDWPNWHVDVRRLSSLLSQVNTERGRLLGKMQALGFNLAEETTLRVLTEDVVKSSEIEGEKLNPESVRSSLARRLGIDIGALPPADRNVDGVVEMVLDATRNFSAALTQDRLFGWHAALFPTGYSGMDRIAVGQYRTDADGPMQVVSGGYGREKVHYVAPPADRLDVEMGRFLDWFNGEDGMDPVIRAGLAHFWLVTIHPFEDGNGRISRAVCDMALARADGSSQRFFSLSSQVQMDRNRYYTVLEQSQKGTMEVTEWMEWFLSCLLRAIKSSDLQLNAALTKAKFWNHWAGLAFNKRQKKMLNMLLDGFEGNLTNKKWVAINNCSPDTALRDINELLDVKVLVQIGGGRSTRYVMEGYSMDRANEIDGESLFYQSNSSSE
jgi:Fic family protein